MDQKDGSESIVSQLCDSILEYWSLMLHQETWALKDTPKDPKAIVTQTWNMTRFILNQERDQLYLWRHDFTQHDLDCLMCNESKVLGGAVLEALVSIGKALLDGTDCTLDSSQKLTQKLRKLVMEGKDLAGNAYFDDDGTMSEATAVSTRTGGPDMIVSVLVAKPQQADLHQIFKSAISRLQSLSFLISQNVK